MGALEEIVIMIILKKEKCHGVEIAEEYESVLNRTISLPSIHVVLKRMEKKGWVRSSFGAPTPERGGKRKKYYYVTHEGYAKVKELQQAKMSLWSSVQNPTLLPYVIS